MILSYIPNILTICRLVLIIPFLMFLYHQQYAHAFYVFFVAGITDALDGWIARKFNCQSALGSFLDPMADKSLIAASFISLALIGQLPWWLVILVFLRDLTISLGVIAWYYFICQKITFEPTQFSKFNTLLQLLLITVCLIEMAFFVFYPGFVTSLMWLTALTTAGSYIDYVWTWGKKAYLKAQLNK